MKRSTVVCALWLALAPAPRPVLAQDGEAFVVVVHASNETRELTQELLARMFLRKARNWRGGQAVVPVDHSLISPLRTSFSRRVLGLSVSEIRDYWMKQTLSGGELAPSVRGSEREVLEFVKGEPGAIAYVSAGTTLPAEVKALKVTQ